MTTEPTRLDQIEALLLQTATTLNQVAAQQAINTQAISELRADTRETLDILMQSLEHAEQDREAWQSEIRRIWEYLRDRNGGSYAA